MDMIRLALSFSIAATVISQAATLSEPLIFTGTCDASAAIALNENLFAVASDEDNILRFYRTGQPGQPIQSYNLNTALAGRRKSPEADIEGAARIGSRIYFVTSHGRNAEGKIAPARERFFALEYTEKDGAVTIKPAGRPYASLITDLIADPRLKSFRLEEAARLSPKTGGGLNIEALTDTPDGTLLIGFRSPVPNGRALIVPLLNPNDLIEGKSPRFGDPQLIDLGGLGLRGIGSTGHGYYLLAGAADDGDDCRLFQWDGGTATPRPISGVDVSRLQPEAICFHDQKNSSRLLILSDDGGRSLGGKDCKDLPEAQRRFRACWIAL
jgi:hypothetical protein